MTVFWSSIYCIKIIKATNTCTVLYLNISTLYYSAQFWGVACERSFVRHYVLQHTHFPAFWNTEKYFLSVNKFNGNLSGKLGVQILDVWIIGVILYHLGIYLGVTEWKPEKASVRIEDLKSRQKSSELHSEQVERCTEITLNWQAIET